MPSPLGDASYKGLAEPLFGDAVVEQENSANAVRTYVLTSANAGIFLRGTLFRADKASSVLTDLTRWDITTAGGYRVVSGTTVLLEFNSSGLLAGGTTLAQWTVGAAGNILGLKQTVTSPTTGASFTISSTQSGTMFNIGNNDGTSQLAVLPRNPAAGVYFDFFVSTQASSDNFSIHSSADSSADIVLPGLSSVVSTHTALEAASVRAHGIRMTAISSVRWFAQPLGQFANAESTVAVGVAEVNWTTATTVA